MRYLWITWIDPLPERDGQRMYSGRLIDAVAAAGARIDVLCFASEATATRPETDARTARVRWHTLPRAPRPSWLSPLSHLPNVAYRCATPQMRRRLRALLEEERWDAVVCDGLAAGWALPFIEELPRRRRPRLIHVSHNHEATTRAAVADGYARNPAVRFALRRDAAKSARLEERLVAAADHVTAITAEDAIRFSAGHPGKHVSVLPPGYAGPRLADRRITRDLPRRVVVVGSFHWVAKRMNLEAFLTAADPLFAQVGAEIQVIGSGDPDVFANLRRRLQATEIVGPVNDVTPYMREARIAIVPELTGGGFKLKILDYVFNRLPILAINGSTAGTPLAAPDSVRLYDDFSSLARGAIDLIDDLETLDRLQRAAYGVCNARFDWDERGRTFLTETAAA